VPTLIHTPFRSDRNQNPDIQVQLSTDVFTLHSGQIGTDDLLTA